MLSVTNIASGYRGKQVLFGIDLEVKPREVVALIGPNGCGKSTLLKSIAGILPVWSGSVTLDGHSINSLDAPARARLGIGFCPQANRVFHELTVEENLVLGALGLERDERNQRIQRSLALVPAVRGRLRVKTDRLSAGEQQMVGMGRVLVREPRLILLDEPSLALAPPLARGIFKLIQDIRRETGAAILVVEQRVREILEECDRVYALRLGHLVYSGNPSILANNSDMMKSIFL